MKHVVGVATMIASCVFFSSSLLACSCSPEGTPEEALQSADAVFRGTVVSVEDAEESLVYPPVGTGKRVVFRVKTVWKGPQEKKIVILTGRGGGDCGFGFTVAGEYLVYSEKTSAGYLTHVCTRTRDVAWLSDRQNAQADFQVLGPGTPIER